ncbi:MAG: NAD-dependent epimerase/dehydratase family protein [Flavobacteriales bacterium]|nr:NAD-dependent epimerase/dehydratase family protein [Flavobacteriales bacterium]
MRIAITGANGHVGAALCPLLLEQGHSLRLLVHRRSDGIADLDAERVSGDLLDAGAVDRFVAGCDAVMHLAARISIDSNNDPLVPRVNVDGTRHIVQACLRHGVKRLVHVSSIHSYDSHPLDAPLDETRGATRATAPAYDRSKAAADGVVLEAVSAHGLSAVILAPTSVFGPLDHGPSLMGRAIADLHNGKVPLLPPGGYDFVDVRDVAQAIAEALHRGAAGSKYLLSGSYRTVRELSAAVGRVAGRRTVQRVAPIGLLRSLVPFFQLQARLTGRTPLMTHEALTALLEGHPDIRSAKARAELGFRPRPFEETLADALDWQQRAGMLIGSGQR